MKPKFFMPAHDQYSMLFANARLAEDWGMKEENVVLAESGSMLGIM
jgi:ribonuclease J